MTSVALRTILAVLVIMPPGAYRTLQELARHAQGRESVASGLRVERSPSVQSDSSSGPIRGRTWCQRTFTWQKSGLSESVDGGDATALRDVALASLDPAHRGLTRRPSAAEAQRCPCAPMLALHELLI